MAAKRERVKAARSYLESLSETLERHEEPDFQQKLALDAMMSHVPTGVAYDPTTLVYQGLSDIDGIQAFDLEEQDFRTAYGASQKSKSRLQGLCTGIFDMHMQNVFRNQYGNEAFRQVESCSVLSEDIARHVYHTEISPESALRYSLSEALYRNGEMVTPDSVAAGGALAYYEANGCPEGVDGNGMHILHDETFAKGAFYQAFLDGEQRGYLSEMSDSLSLTEKTAAVALSGDIVDAFPNYACEIPLKNIDRPSLASSERVIAGLLNSAGISDTQDGKLSPEMYAAVGGQVAIQNQAHRLVQDVCKHKSQEYGLSYDTKVFDAVMSDYLKDYQVPEDPDTQDAMKTWADLSMYHGLTTQGIRDRYMILDQAFQDCGYFRPAAEKSEKQADAVAPAKTNEAKGARFVLQNAFPTKDGKGYMAQFSFANDLPQKNGEYLAGTACSRRPYTTSDGKSRMNFTRYYTKDQIDAVQSVANHDGDKPVFRAEFFKKGSDVVINTNTVRSDSVAFDAKAHAQHSAEAQALAKERRAKQAAPSVSPSVEASNERSAQASGPELG